MWGGRSLVFYFKNADDYDRVWGFSSKVWMKKDDLDCVGYMMEESDDGLKVMMMVPANSDIVTLACPCFSAIHGRYIISEDSLSHTQYTIFKD